MPHLLIQGWYSPEFGLKHPRHTLTFMREDQVLFEMGYLLIPGQIRSAEMDIQFRQGQEIYEVAVDGNKWIVTVDLKNSTLSWTQKN